MTHQLPTNPADIHHALIAAHDMGVKAAQKAAADYLTKLADGTADSDDHGDIGTNPFHWITLPDGTVVDPAQHWRDRPDLFDKSTLD